jgi:hypothetical protein
LNRFIGEAPMNTAGAAVLPGTGRTANSSQPGKSLFAKGHWYKLRRAWSMEPGAWSMELGANPTED